MVSCWKQDPSQRPLFGELVKIFDQKLQTKSVSDCNALDKAWKISILFYPVTHKGQKGVSS